MKRNGNLEKYVRLSKKYLDDADALLRKGDLAQASEKLWGSTATMVKAIAAQRKKSIKTHDGITFFLSTIAKELKDESILNVILTANALHQNFYEDILTPEVVKKGEKITKQFIRRMINKFNLDLQD